MPNILLPTRMEASKGISSSARRYFVDRFYTSHADIFSQAESILDVGGTKGKKRGQFDIATCSQRVTVLNIDDGKGADIVCDAASMPMNDNLYDVVICAEVLEHVRHPEKVLSEVARVCRPGGKVFLTAPFLFPIHADPYDFRRYTDVCWKEMIAEAGLDLIQIQAQGNFYTVLMDMLRMWIYNKIQNKILRYSLYFLIKPFITLSIESSDKTADRFIGSFTTGYSVIAQKPFPAA